jgi:hypothetical protein
VSALTRFHQIFQDSFVTGSHAQSTCRLPIVGRGSWSARARPGCARFARRLRRP